MRIQILDQHTAELIAAGEVVERPSSVVKELAENAIDAGARSLTIEIEQGGLRLIRLQDDGSGIEAEDIPLAFVRHATSKVRTQDDLDCIKTLGFRGEALASIASVSQVQLLTRTSSDEFAALYRIEGGEEIGLEAAARPVGTTISVHNLFYNTPARMKFLKKDASEGTFVGETVTRLALSHPEVAFCFMKDGKTTLSTPGDGLLASAVYSAIGRDFARDLVAVRGDSKQYAVHGLITPPVAGRASRSMQFFYVNGRFVKNRTMMAALEQAYRGMSMHGRFPGCVLFLDMPPELVDVNVHPAKTEVRFARESDIFEVVYKSVKSALMSTFTTHAQFGINKDNTTKNVVQQLNRGGDESPELYTSNIPQSGELLTHETAKSPLAVEYNGVGGMLGSSSAAAPYETRSSMPSFAYRAENALDIFVEEGEAEALSPSKGAEPFLPLEPTQTRMEPESTTSMPLKYLGEVFKTYILAERDQTLCLIDKHAAHERIIYEKLLKQRDNPASQQLLAPLSINLSAVEKNAVLQNADALCAAGIDVEDFGSGSILVRGVPADVQPPDVTDLIVEVAARLAVNSRDTGNKKTEWVLNSVACRAAVKAGDNTHPQLLLKLAEDILNGEIPPFCPHGRPVVLEITRKELEKQFGRLG